MASFRRGNFELGVNLVDYGAGAASALIVHRRNLLLAPGLLVVFEDDDLCVLTAQLDHRVDLRVQLLYGKRNRVHFLHKFCADHFGDGPAARAGDKNAGVFSG